MPNLVIVVQTLQAYVRRTTPRIFPVTLESIGYPRLSISGQ